MGKTIDKPSDEPAGTSAGTTPADDSNHPIVHGNPNLSPEQQQKYAELIEWLDRRRAAAERMTPEERCKPRLTGRNSRRA